MKNKFRSIAIITMIIMIVTTLTACGGAKVPDQYNYNYDDYIKLGKYEGLTYKEPDTNVTEAEVQDYIDGALAAEAKKTEITEGYVAEDSIVKIDYAGTIDGKKSENATGNDYELDIANSTFIEGFAEALVGHSVGETFTIDLVFPEDYYDPDIAGKPAQFEITVKALIQSELPELDDDFVKKNSEFDNVQAYKEDVKKKLQENKAKQADAAVKSELFQQIYESSEIKKIPEKELAAAKESIIENYKQLAEANDMEYADFIKGSLGMTEEEFNEQISMAAENTVKQELTVYALADKLGVKISKSEYNDYIDKMLKDADMTRDTYKETFGSSVEEYAEKNGLYVGILYDEAMNVVIEKGSAE